MNLSEFCTKRSTLYVGISTYYVNHDEIYEIVPVSFVAFSKNSYKHNKIYIVAAYP